MKVRNASLLAGSHFLDILAVTEEILSGFRPF